VGDLPIEQITREHIEAFRDGLIKTGISATTVQKYLDVLKALFRWAKRERRLIKINPAEDVSAPRDTRSSDKKGRRPFNTQELKGVLMAAQSAWSKRGRDRDLLMMLRVLLYTGARPMEIAQLRPCDVQDGVISINDHNGKQIKNEASVRDIPIHPAIADFEKFAKSGGKLVFKSFETIGDRKAEALSSRFTRLLRQHLHITDQRKTLYSLRHNFADACRNARLSPSIQYQLMGHVESNRNAAGYGTGASIQTLRRELAKVDPLS
jgi:integrase